MDRTRGLRPVRLAFALALLIVMGAACNDDPREGTALELGGPAVNELPARTGEFLVWDSLFLRNTSTDPIVLQRIEPIDVEGEDLVDILGIEVQGRGKPPTGGGFHKTYPPTMFNEQERVCATAPLFPVAGHELEPGAERRVAVALELIGPGSFRVSKWRFHYRDEDGDAFQDSQFAVGIQVEQKGRPQKVFPDERRCLKETESQSLRDAVEDGTYGGT